MSKNRLTHLNDHLFEQLERLSDNELKGDALIEECNRAKAKSMIAKDIINNAALVLEGRKYVTENDHRIPRELPPMMQDHPKLKSIGS